MHFDIMLRLCIPCGKVDEPFSAIIMEADVRFEVLEHMASVLLASSTLISALDLLPINPMANPREHIVTDRAPKRFPKNNFFRLRRDTIIVMAIVCGARGK